MHRVFLPLTALSLLTLTGAAGRASATVYNVTRFEVVDPQTGKLLPGGCVTLESTEGRHLTLPAGLLYPSPTVSVDLSTLEPVAETAGAATSLIALTPGETRRIHLRIPDAVPLNSRSIVTPSPGAPQVAQRPPVRDITIVVRATLLRRQAPTAVTSHEVSKNGGGTAANGSVNSLISHDAGVTADSSGQQHVRGEHAEVAYVVDGVLLPDTLSGRQGAVVVLSTIDRLDLLTGSYAPEFGGQTAAVLDITTLPTPRKPRADLDIDRGSYDTQDGTLTLSGPISKYAGYVLNLGASRTRAAVEPQQPDVQTAHNTGANLIEFAKFRFQPGHADTLNLTLSRSPDTLQINNRTGLPSSFHTAGQGYGFLGLRNADGSRPDVTADISGLLGAQNILLPSQQAEGQDITAREVSEFATLAWQHRFSSVDTGQLAFTLLHSGQDVVNHNPTVNLLNLPADNSIEYNPTAIRNVHHVQFTGSISAPRGSHRLKAGFLADDQLGNEAYNLVPASQLALDLLAINAPNLAPEGAPVPQLDAGGKPMMDGQGSPVYVTDINKNPIYKPTTGASPTIKVHRSGFYRAAYLQDTWQVSRRATFNYGVRADWYRQGQNLGQPIVDTLALSPRLNFSYTPDRLSVVRLSYNRLLNTPPLAQGAVVGQPIHPETLNQYEVGVQRQVAPGQSVELAYYVKDIRNQVDTGLLIPGSQIGIYSAVNFEIGGVHGIEFSYDLSAPRRKNSDVHSGIDAFVNYSYSIASPNGFDNTGLHAPIFNDHDQRNTLGFGLGYTFPAGQNLSMTLQHGSGLASSSIPPSPFRTPRTQIDLHLGSGDHLFKGRGGLNVDVQNLLDDRTVINFQSAFSGTRFQQARRFLVSLSGRF